MKALKALKAFIKPFEAPQRSVKIRPGRANKTQIHDDETHALLFDNLSIKIIRIFAQAKILKINHERDSVSH